MFLVWPIKRTTLLHCIDIFVLTFGFVNLPDVHGLSSTALILSSQLLSHIGRNSSTKLFIMGIGPSRNLSSIAAVFTLSATTSENFDSCSTSVSSPLHDCHLELIGTLWRYSLAIDADCSTTDLGLNQCVTANQA